MTIGEHIELGDTVRIYYAPKFPTNRTPIIEFRYNFEAIIIRYNGRDYIFNVNYYAFNLLQRRVNTYAKAVHIPLLLIERKYKADGDYRGW